MMAINHGQIEAALMEIWSGTQTFMQCTRSNNFIECYVSSNPLYSALAGVFVLAVYCFVWSIIGQNASKVDQIWSITPILFCWHFYIHRILSGGGVHDRLLALCICITVWGVRLTYNFWKKGGYGNFFQHEEDYRWPIIRKQIGPVFFLLLNITFIASYQNFLLFLIASPALVVMQGPSEIALNDWMVIGAFVGFFIIETVADHQHWIYQSYKHSLTPEARAAHKSKDIRNGFYSEGLFRYSRHPNYFAEQMMWVCVYLMSITPKESSYVNWSSAGCILLILLFQGSMNFGESITLAKYPKYKDYQASTSQCIMWFPSSPRNKNE